MIKDPVVVGVGGDGLGDRAMGQSVGNGGNDSDDLLSVEYRPTRIAITPDIIMVELNLLASVHVAIHLAGLLAQVKVNIHRTATPSMPKSRRCHRGPRPSPDL